MVMLSLAVCQVRRVRPRYTTPRISNVPTITEYPPLDQIQLEILEDAGSNLVFSVSDEGCVPVPPLA